MTSLTLLLGRAGALLIVATVAGVVLASAGVRGAGAWRRRESHLRRELRFLRWPVSARHLLGAQAGGAAGVLVGIPLGSWLLVALGLALIVGPHLWVRRARRRRTERIEEQLEGWVTSIAHALESTGSLGEALRSSAHLVERPLRDELGQILAEHHLGSPLDRALQAAAERVQSRLFSAVLLTLQIGRNTGGSLRGVLRETAASLREMKRLEGVLRTKTAEGKAQAAVISALPLPLYSCIRTLAPGFFDPLETTPLGHAIVAAATLLWVSAALLARRFLAVDL